MVAARVGFEEEGAAGGHCLGKAMEGVTAFGYGGGGGGRRNEIT